MRVSADRQFCWYSQVFAEKLLKTIQREFTENALSLPEQEYVLMCSVLEKIGENKLAQKLETQYVNLIRKKQG